MKLCDDNTLEVSAALDVAVTAITTLGTGTWWGHLGCWRFYRCSAVEVVFSAHIDMKVVIKGKWILENEYFVFEFFVISISFFKSAFSLWTI